MISEALPRNSDLPFLKSSFHFSNIFFLNFYFLKKDILEVEKVVLLGPLSTNYGNTAFKLTPIGKKVWFCAVIWRSSGEYRYLSNESGGCILGFQRWLQNVVLQQH